MSNPIEGNRFASPADTAQAVRALVAPLLPHFRDGNARLRLGPGGAHFPEAAADLEGLSRPFWGLAPLAAGGHAYDHWAPFQEGLANGANPDHPGFWGWPVDFDQRIVESAAIGFALALAPQAFWDGLPGSGRDHLARWLIAAIDAEPHSNNWMFFRVLVSLGLRRVGVAHDRSKVEISLDRLEALDIGNGWYRDGPWRRAEHYIPFAMHYYALLYAGLAEDDQARCARFGDRAARFAPQLRDWYADDGAALPFGRSLTYRFAHAGFWGAAAFAGVESLPPGELRGYWARNLRWWGRQDMADRDGVLGIGYAYPNLLVSETYNSQGSPYWALKAFLPLALPASHPFWQADEAPPAKVPAVITQPEPGMVLWSEPGQVTALCGGQDAPSFRHGPEKYTKFGYSTRYGFSVESHARSFETGPLDSMLAFSEDGTRWAVRETEEEARIAPGLLCSRWRPLRGVEVETWLLAEPPWQLRIHRVTSDRSLAINESGFAIERSDADPRQEAAPGRATVETATDLAAVLALEPDSSRTGRVLKADPNTSLQFPRTWVPQLRGRIEAGTTLLVTAILASPDRDRARAALAAPPTVPALAELERRWRDEAKPVVVWQIG